MKKLLLLLLSFSLFACTPDSDKQDTQLLLISFDGFRADYLEKTDTPNFDALVEQGVSSEGLIPVFPTKTFPNHYAIVTGLYPENNGLVGNSMYDPVMDASYRISDRDAVENPDWYEGEPIWNTVEKQGKKAGTMFWVGSEAPIQDMRPSHWKIFDSSVPDRARIDTVLKWMSYPEAKRIDFGTLYFSFVDSQGHRYGPDSPEVVSAIQKADSLVGYLMNGLEDKGIRDQVNIMIVADHGMISLSKDKLIVLDDLIDPDDVNIISASPVLGMNPKEGKLNEVYEALKAKEEHYTVYKKEDLPERYGLKNHRRTPKILVLTDPEYSIAARAYIESLTYDFPSGGAHGFDNTDPRMHAIFVGAGPDFHEGYRKGTFSSIHLYELMTHLLNVDPSINDGNFDEVRDMLK